MNGEIRTTVLQELEDAVQELIRVMAADLIPEVGSNIEYAIPQAKDKDDVAAVQGRIVRLAGAPHPVGPVEFGASDHVTRIVLTAMKFDPGVRTAANIRFTPEIIGIIEDLLLEMVRNTLPVISEEEDQVVAVQDEGGHAAAE